MAHSLKVSCLAYEQSCLSFTILWPFLLLPAAAKLWPRLCFYTCLWFCSRGGGLQRTPPPVTRQTPPPGPGRHPPGQGEHTPPPGPGRYHPPPPGTRQIPLLQENPPPPGKKTAAYGHWAAGTHPTGMHSCSQCRSFILLPFVIHNSLKKWWIP